MYTFDIENMVNMQNKYFKIGVEYSSGQLG